MSINQPEPPVSSEQQESAALAALGLLSPRECASLPPELIQQMTDIAVLLAESVVPVAPPPSLKERLQRRVADHETLRPIADVRHYENEWVNPGIPGVDIKKLFTDSNAGRTTMLVRMAPGVKLPKHRHHDDEQCLVLHGDIRFGELVYNEGDFIVMGKGTIHPETYTVGGNLLLIMSGHTEFMHA